MPTSTTMPAEQARALAVLAKGNTAQDAAAETGLKLATVVQVARRQGWTVHPTTGLAADLSRDDSKPVLPDDIAHLAEECEPKPRIVITLDENPVDELLADARRCNDRHVQAALRRAESAIGKLADAYSGVAERIAAEQAREAAKQAALDEVADLERQLVEARRRVKAAGVAPGRVTRRSADGATDAEIRAWAAENGIDCNSRGAVSSKVRRQHGDAHRRVAV
ncbi:Lsr2 family DNA-binding protein [Streptosporangium roseum]|uniref:Lsr2 family DNA-binding protein n=1 Tax=Streptosporangium roseum TaxID=2001 RepID=UPI00331C69AE